MRRHILHLPSVTSTNDYAKELLATHDYVVVSAEHQTAGRGRNGKVWYGEEHKNIYCSFGIRHISTPHHTHLPLYMACGALAVIDTLRSLEPTLDVRLKYPNDVHVRDQGSWCKIAGVLVEHEFVGSTCTTTVIGIGFNVEQTLFPDTITQPCTSLHRLGCVTTVQDVLVTLTQYVESSLNLSSTELSSRWINELKPTTTTFRIEGNEGLWKIVGLGDDGRLHVQHTTTHIERIISDGDTLRYED